MQSAIMPRVDGLQTRADHCIRDLGASSGCQRCGHVGWRKELIFHTKDIGGSRKIVKCLNSRDLHFWKGLIFLYTFLLVCNVTYKTFFLCKITSSWYYWHSWIFNRFVMSYIVGNILPTGMEIFNIHNFCLRYHHMLDLHVEVSFICIKCLWFLLSAIPSA